MSTVKRETEEFRLLRNLFKDYDKEVRPVYNTSDVVNVNFSLSLIQIISVVSWSDIMFEVFFELGYWLKKIWKYIFKITRFQKKLKTKHHSRYYKLLIDFELSPKKELYFEFYLLVLGLFFIYWQSAIAQVFPRDEKKYS